MLLSTQTDFLSRRLGDEDALRFIKNAGFDAADFGMFHYSGDESPLRYEEGAFESYFSRLGGVAREIGLRIGQTHAPFPSYAGDEADEDRLLLQKKAVYASFLLGSPYMVMHPAIPKGCVMGRGGEEAFSLNMERYASLIPVLKETGVKIAIENMFSSDPETGNLCQTVCSLASEMNRYIDTLNEQADCFVACLDVGHAMIVGQSPQNMVLQLGKRLKVLHVQDTDGSGDWHTLPGLGKVNWKKFIAALGQANYTGSFSLEADRFPTAFGIENAQECYALMRAVAGRIANA